MKALFLFLLLSPFTLFAQHSTILLEAESFNNTGGWVIDQQSMDQMGSPYLLAHGLGLPVDDATTTFEIQKDEEFFIWVRTRDWAGPWKNINTSVDEKAMGYPGKFKILLDKKPLEPVFGTEKAEWAWQKGGTIKLKTGDHTIALHDLTGFDGRCDAIVLTTDTKFTPPNTGRKMMNFRKKVLNLPEKPLDGGEFDFIVVGGGMAGCCAAVSAARLGLKVALIQNRPVLGGNNSSEVRVGLSGLIHQNSYPRLGDLVDEIGSVGHWTLWEAEQNPSAKRSKMILDEIEKHPEKKEHNAGPASNYGDDKKRRVIENEKNISLFLNNHVFEAVMKKGNIEKVLAKNITTGEITAFKGKLFADCTGDGNLGFLAGADFRMGREGKDETGEKRAPEKSDDLVMGTSVQWNSIKEDKESKFPTCPWAIQFNENSCHYVTKGDWDWETGFYRNQINDIEFIRDYALRVVYGNWDYIKNKGTMKEKFANRRLSWVAYIGGKRESRRFLGDVILKEQDILDHKFFPDATFTTTWGMDLHYPIEPKGLDVAPYRARADVKSHEPYDVPYRCLYSRNVNNLFMAGRNISVTHVALGTVRVMRTTGMMGEVVGRAASICIHEDCTPRQVYSENLPMLKDFLQMGL